MLYRLKPWYLFFFVAACGSTYTSSPLLYCDLESAQAGAFSAEVSLHSYQRWYWERIGIEDLWEKVGNGAGVHISIVDDALDIEHGDLKANIVLNQTINYLEPPSSSLRHNPLPIDCNEDGHGTAVSGIIAAAAGDDIGIKGIAYGARIYLANYLSSTSGNNLQDALGRHTEQTAVSSNSWGGSDVTRLRKRGRSILSTIEERLKEGYGGKGISYVFAAGNHRNVSGREVLPASADRTTYSELLNHRGMILVCAVKADDKYASYSTPGTNLWICAPSGDSFDFDCTKRDRDSPETFFGANRRGLATTDIRGVAGYNTVSLPRSILDFGTASGGVKACPGVELPEVAGDGSYTRFFSGTSAAAPVVSGIIAVLRAKKPQLSWRDIKLILAESAEKIDAAADSWQQGAAAYHDENSGYAYSDDYGFGLINASAAGELANDWTVLEDKRMKEGNVSIGPISIEPGEFAHSIHVSDSSIDFIDFIEFVNLEMTSDYSNFGHLNITLKSPRGMESVLSRAHPCLDWDPGFKTAQEATECDDLKDGFFFGSAAHLGEDPQADGGEWTLRIDGAMTPASLNGTLRFWGHTK